MTPTQHGAWQTSSVPAVDQLTLTRFRQGDDAAVQQVVSVYGRMMFTVCHRVLRSRSLAEEATQQAFVQAWRGASSFDVESDPAPWLATIARRTAIDVLRRESRRPSTPLDDVPSDDRSMVSLPPNAEQMWTVWQVRRAIDELPDDERTVVRLQHLEGFSQSQIADRLGVPLGTVKSRSFRAHKTLVERLRHVHAEGAA
jgi:RNA polymerase sigma-70 factor (ECF subfamily)